MKKGQHEGKAVAILVLIIGLFMVLYILFLPVEERQELLGNKTIRDGVSDKGVKTLLLESPGWVSGAREFKTKHEVDSINLFVKIEPEIIALANKLEIRKRLFTSSFPSVSFDVDDLSDLNKASLTFSVSDPKGRLKIVLNGNTFYEEQLKTGALKIVEIPSGLLKSSNKIVFMVNSPGIAFWGSNHYTLGGVALKQEFERINSKETRTFSIKEGEMDNLDNAELSYFLYCNSLEGQYSNLRIYLNKEQLFSGLVRCAGTRMSVEIEANDLDAGRNELMFVIDNGDFLFSNIKVETSSKEARYPEYHFSLDNDDFEDVENDEKDVVLRLELDDKGNKRGTIFVNGKEIIINTNADKFEKEISSFVEEGDNLIKIVPGIEFNINLLKITLE